MPSKRLPIEEYKVLCMGVYARDDWRCRFCKRRCALHAHHVIFRSHGGEDVMSNLATICNNHHDMIHCGLFKIVGDANGKLLVTSPKNPLVRFTI